MVEIKVGKKGFICVGLVIALLGFGLVYGYGGTSPSVMGHSASEIYGAATERYVDGRVNAVFGAGAVEKNNCYWKVGESCSKGESMMGYSHGNSGSGIYCCGVGEESISYCSVTSFRDVVSSCNACGPGICGNHNGKKKVKITVVSENCSASAYFRMEDCSVNCGGCMFGASCDNGRCVGGGTVICTEAHRQGYLSHELYEADKEFAERNIDRETFLGYHSWGRPVARLMSKDKRVADIIIPLTIGWAEHMAYSVGGDDDSEIGELLMDVGLPVCRELGEMMIEDGRTDYEFDEKFVRERILFYLDRYDVETLSDDSVKMEFKEDMKLFFEDLESVYLSEKSNDLLNSEFSSFEFLA